MTIRTEQKITESAAKVTFVVILAVFLWALYALPEVVVANSHPRYGLIGSAGLLLTVILILAALVLGIQWSLGGFRPPSWGTTGLQVLAWLVIAFGLKSLFVSIYVSLPTVPLMESFPWARIRLFLYSLYVLRIGVEWQLRFQGDWVHRRFAGIIKTLWRLPLPKNERIAAWLFIADGCICLLLPAIQSPAVIAWGFVTGTSASAAYVMYALAELPLGIGLLHRNELSKMLVRAYLTAGAINLLIYAVLPGRGYRTDLLLSTFAPGLAGSQFDLATTVFWLLLGLAVVARLTLIWLLFPETITPLNRAFRRLTDRSA